MPAATPTPAGPVLPDLQGAASRGWTALVRVDVELDLATAARVRQDLLDALAPAPDRLVVDLSGCRFVGATGAQLLLEAHLRAGRQGTRMTLCGCRPQALWVLGLAGLQDVLEQEGAVGSPRAYDASRPTTSSVEENASSGRASRA